MMARLNEPPMSTDGLEILKRKFLRQNREIARINSNQSQRIRELENDCARMLSENLELRGEILRLENEMERNASQRIADHALEVKAKLEAQLSIVSTLLEGLGEEPPRKRPAREDRRPARSKLSHNLTSPARRLRNVAKDQEALAMQEGRLPPIPENRSYPRATLNGDEIRAMLSEAADTTDSPDLGPPPVSRFVDVDPVKVDSPSSKSVAAQLEMVFPDSAMSAEALTPARPKLDFGKNSANVPRSVEHETPHIRIKTEAPTDSTASITLPQQSKAGSKRKYGDENERVMQKQGSEGKGVEKPRPLQDLQKQKALKDIPSSRRERAPLGEKVLSHPGRKALSTKSTNEDLLSPRKVDRAASNENLKASKTPAEKANSRPNVKRSAPIIEIPPPPPAHAPPLISIIDELESPLPDTPMTPDHSAPRARANDTPPPSAINSDGEAIRPSRRARAAVSYAEPNLRDKMRRPTKELFDAVSGEGKFRQRASISAGTLIKEEPRDESEAASASAVKEATVKQEAGREAPLSPLARRKTQEPTPVSDPDEALSSAGVTQRKRRGSSMAARESFGFTNAPTQTASPDSANDEPSGVDSQSSDPYDFNTSSPGPAGANEKTRSMIARPTSRKPRASASFQGNAGSLASDKGRELGRKRSSMAALKTKASFSVETDDGEESSIDGEPVAKDRVSRRRSMML